MQINAISSLRTSARLELDNMRKSRLLVALTHTNPLLGFVWALFFITSLTVIRVSMLTVLTTPMYPVAPPQFQYLTIRCPCIPLRPCKALIFAPTLTSSTKPLALEPWNQVRSVSILWLKNESPESCTLHSDTARTASQQLAPRPL
ncbi:hypothetical protein BD779DRAFT_1558906 [Infundibulicybe gibba]|nr:hypothetical protein BD779DRAFT_1558906 [Infundibulicybe gibba]